MNIRGIDIRLKKNNDNDHSSSPSQQQQQQQHHHHQNHASKLEVKGKLIVVEGIDGSGKSTQIRLVGKWLKSRLIPVFMT